MSISPSLWSFEGLVQFRLALVTVLLFFIQVRNAVANRNIESME